MCAVLLYSSQLTYGQKVDNKAMKKARTAFAAGKYNEAKSFYFQVLATAPEFPDALFETGLCYFNSNVQKDSSVHFFERALLHSGKDTIPEMVYYLGRSYHYADRFEDAIKTYQLFKSFTSSKGAGMLLARDVDRFIEMCNTGRKLTNQINTEIRVVNLGVNVNSEFSEYSPVVKKDESMLIYTARRPSTTGGKVFNDDKHFEDIYISLSNQNAKTWTSAVKIDSSKVFTNTKINTKWHDAVISFSDNEEKLFIYRQNHVWVSESKNGAWTNPIKLGKEINSKGHEPSIFLTHDERSMFVVSNRKEGFGGRDIYWTHKDGSGNWRALKNLGPSINTKYDEDAPYFMRDGKTLFFSSNGHTTMGGYDVFKSVLQSDSTWSVPENLGVPINSSGDDIYYVPSDNLTYAYHSSSRKGGLGDMDIYRIQLTCENLPNTEIKGRVFAGIGRTPVGGFVRITASDGVNLGDYPIDPETGKYILVLPPDKEYTLEVHTPNSIWEQTRPHRETVFVPKQCEPFALYQEVYFKHLQTSSEKSFAQEATFHNALFNIADSAANYYKITGQGSGIKPLEETEGIQGQIRYNDILNAKNIEVYLMNSQGKIVRSTRTDNDGNYAFNDLNSQEIYTIGYNISELKNQYFGLNSNSDDIDLVLKGQLNRLTSMGTKISPVADDFEIYLLTDNKMISRATSTKSGIYQFDADDSGLDVKKLNSVKNITYDLSQDGMDYAISAYIRTHNIKSNSNYTEIIDLIQMDTTGIDAPSSLLAFENIYFDFDKFFLRDKSKDVLEKIYNYLASNPNIKVQMDGHTDWIGSDEYNMALSKNRANSSYNYLVTRGISPNRIERKWFGESKPTAPNAKQDGGDNPDGRQLNRRVEFKLTFSDMELTFSGY